MTPAVLEGARGFVGLAWADELDARPALLEAWAALFGADDDVTLVVLAGSEARLDALAAAVDELGAPDVLAVAVDGPPYARGPILDHVHVVLSGDERAHLLPLPVAGTHSAYLLRELELVSRVSRAVGGMHRLGHVARTSAPGEAQPGLTPLAR